MAAVNTSARPGAQLRRERARATRRRILEAAYRLFAEQGYAVSMDALAAEAGVAVQTLYFTFHTKAELLKGAVGLAAAGEDEPVPVIQRPWMKELETATTGERVLALLVEHGTDIRRRVAPLTPAIQSASSVDPEVAQYWESVNKERHAGMRHHVALLARKGWLRQSLNLDQAADILHVLHGPDVFLAFTAGCGWSVEAFKGWQYVALCQELLGTRPRRRLTRRALDAARGTSFHGVLAD